MIRQKQEGSISGIDKGLTMQCDIAFGWNDALIDFLRKLPLKVPGFLSITKEKSAIRYYVPASVESSVDVKRNLTMLGATKINDLWMVEQDVSNTPISEIIELFLSVRSVALDMVMFESGHLKFRFRFHLNYLVKISEIVLKNVSENDLFSVEYLGESYGLLTTLKEISSFVPLSAVEFQFVLPHAYVAGAENPFRGKWIRIRKTDSGSMKFRHIYYAPEGLVSGHSKDVEIISEQDHLYEMITENPLVANLMNETESKKIYTLWINQYDNNAIMARVWLNSVYVKEFLGIIDGARREFGEWDISISMVGTLEDIFSRSKMNFL
ncbi:MAG: hypothetical protein ACP5NK_05735 [Thermoplasmata archaeon]